MPKFPSLARPSKTEDWHGGDGDAPTLSDGATVSSPGERRFDFDDTPPVGMREESLAPQTTEDFVGESLKRDLDFPSARHSEFPILQRPWQVADANRFKSSTAEQKSSDNEYAYVKLLLRSSVAQKLMTLCENNEQVASLLRPCHMQVSPPSCFFPGTRDRVLSLKARELQSVLSVVRFIAQLVSDSAATAMGQGLCLREAKPELKIAVPRKVIGTIIGRGGSHIQELRHNTMAHIHISPLFVSSEAACGERVISIVSRDQSSLFRASQTVISKINDHPDRAACRRIVYHQHAAGDFSDLACWRRRVSETETPTAAHVSSPLKSQKAEEVARRSGRESGNYSWRQIFREARFWQAAVWSYVLCRILIYFLNG